MKSVTAERFPDYIVWRWKTFCMDWTFTETKYWSLKYNDVTITDSFSNKSYRYFIIVRQCVVDI